jgi:response regulator RpfG family c-di-GMP phosphodiesterase
MDDQCHVLCVDDEPKVLEGLALILRRNFRVSTAMNGQEALSVVEGEDPPGVVVSDLRMPEMDGNRLLSLVRERAPEAVRVLLTGQADVESAIAAVNHGQVFRFLTKPCKASAFLTAIQSAAEQHHILTAERLLLEQTLRGSIKALTDILSLSNPLAFGRAVRLRERAAELLGALRIKVPWQVEVAAMLSQLGCIVLPAAINEKLYYAKPLNHAEIEILRDLPNTTSQIVGNIPRMEMVTAILQTQHLNYDGTGSPPGSPQGESLPLGARVLKVVADHDVLESSGVTSDVAVEMMRRRDGYYDPRLLAGLAVLAPERKQSTRREMALSEVTVGMVLADDVLSSAGALLVPRGQGVSAGLLSLLRNLSTGTVREPIVVGAQAVVTPDRRMRQ